MSATEIISEIRKLPDDQRREVFRFVNEQIQDMEDRLDDEAADRALEEPGESIPWEEAKRRLGWV